MSNAGRRKTPVNSVILDEKNCQIHTVTMYAGFCAIIRIIIILAIIIINDARRRYQRDGVYNTSRKR